MYKAVMVLTVFLIWPFAAWSSAEESVVAWVNGAPISGRDVEIVVNRIAPRASFHGNISEEKWAELREQALQEMIDKELQYQDAIARGIKPDKKLVNERLDLIKKRFQSKAEYKEALKREGISEREFKARIEKEIVIESAIERIVNTKARMTPQELKEYYEKNIEKFRQPDSLRLRIISVKNEEKARDALKRVKAGEDFGSVAARVSEDNYRIKGGDIGYIHRGMIYRELEDAAFKAGVGEVGGPLKSEGKWFIFKVEDRKPERLLEYDEIELRLRAELESKKRAELLRGWIGELRRKAEIIIQPMTRSSRAGESGQGVDSAH